MNKFFLTNVETTWRDLLVTRDTFRRIHDVKAVFGSGTAIVASESWCGSGAIHKFLFGLRINLNLNPCANVFKIQVRLLLLYWDNAFFKNSSICRKRFIDPRRKSTDKSTENLCFVPKYKIFVCSEVVVSVSTKLSLNYRLQNVSNSINSMLKCRLRSVFNTKFPLSEKMQKWKSDGTVGFLL